MTTALTIAAVFFLLLALHPFVTYPLSLLALRPFVSRSRGLKESRPAEIDEGQPVSFAICMCA